VEATWKHALFSCRGLCDATSAINIESGSDASGGPGGASTRGEAGARLLAVAATVRGQRVIKKKKLERS
jgi:hypothetical protein